MRKYVLSFLIIINIALCNAQESNFDIILTPQDSLSTYNMTCIPTLGVGVIINNGVFFVDDEADKDIMEIAISEDMRVDDVIVCGEEIIFKSRNNLYMWQKNNGKPILELDTEFFNISRSNNPNELFITYCLSHNSKLFKYNLKSKQLVQLLDLPEIITQVLTNNDNIIIVADNHIYVANNDWFDCVMEYPRPITCACYTPEGILFSSAVDTNILMGKNKFRDFGNFGCRQVFYDNKKIYLRTSDDYLIVVDL